MLENEAVHETKCTNSQWGGRLSDGLNTKVGNHSGCSHNVVCEDGGVADVTDAADVLCKMSISENLTATRDEWNKPNMSEGGATQPGCEGECMRKSLITSVGW